MGMPSAVCLSAWLVVSAGVDEEEQRLPRVRVWWGDPGRAGELLVYLAGMSVAVHCLPHTRNCIVMAILPNSCS